MNDHLTIHLLQRVDGIGMKGLKSTSQQTLIAIAFLGLFTTAATGQDQVSPQPLPSSARPPQIDRAGFPKMVAPQVADIDDPKQETATTFSGPLVTTVSSLVIVLSIFAGLVWISRNYGGGTATSGVLPKDVLQHLGSSPLDSKTKVTFLKCGNRILVVAQTQNGDPQTLTEITDTDEVERITNRCMGRPEIIGRRPESGTQHSRIDYAAG